MNFYNSGINLDYNLGTIYWGQNVHTENIYSNKSLMVKILLLRQKKINKFCFDIAAKLKLLLEEKVLLCKSDYCFISKITKSKSKKRAILFLYFDFVDNVEFCYTGLIRYTNNN
jgi:hypothetical protein